MVYPTVFHDNFAEFHLSLISASDFSFRSEKGACLESEGDCFFVTYKWNPSGFQVGDSGDLLHRLDIDHYAYCEYNLRYSFVENTLPYFTDWSSISHVKRPYNSGFTIVDIPSSMYLDDQDDPILFKVDLGSIKSFSTLM